MDSEITNTHTHRREQLAAPISSASESRSYKQLLRLIVEHDRAYTFCRQRAHRVRQFITENKHTRTHAHRDDTPHTIIAQVVCEPSSAIAVDTNKIQNTHTRRSRASNNNNNKTAGGG